MSPTTRRVLHAAVESCEPRILMATISGTIFNDTNLNSALNAGEPGLHNHRLYLDNNANGVYDAGTGVFETAVTLPSAIPDTTTQFRNVTVPNLGGTITDINVRLSFRHTNMDHLDVFLISPAGTRVELFTDIGGTGDHAISLFLDDAATLAANAAAAPFTGPYRPEGLLSTFNGQSTAGTWQLEITDDTAGTTGTLAGLALSITTTAAEPTTLADINGGFSFTGLAAGTYNLRTAIAPLWAGTTIADGGVVVVNAPSAAGTYTGNNIALRRPLGEIRGTRFYDVNNNGTRELGEPGLPNQIVFLDTNANGIRNVGETFTTTDATGAYAFLNLAPGNYTVAAEQANGYAASSPGGPATISSLGATPLASDWDSVSNAISQAADLARYTPAQIDAATTWIARPAGRTDKAAFRVAQAIFADDYAADPRLAGAYAYTVPAGRGQAVADAFAAAGVEFAYPIVQGNLVRRSTVNDPMQGAQWHLRNTGQLGGAVGADARVEQAWTGGWTGRGVVLSAIDDGIEVSHADLNPNYNASLSTDAWIGDANPQAEAGDFHGTSVIGVMAGRGGNGVGMSGASPLATISAIRGGVLVDSNDANAFNFQRNAISVYNASWGPSDDGFTLEAPGPLVQQSFVNGVTLGRNGLGNVYTWAAGNGGSGDNANYDGYASSRYTNAIAALSVNDTQSSYSESGASLLVATPSSDAIGIYTTDRIGAANGYGGITNQPDYTNDFGGTSSAAPLAAGVTGLMLEANPFLTWRDVQHVLAKTARKNSPADAGWANNGAGLPFNHKFGFGVANADAAVALAQTWDTVGPETSVTSGTLAVAAAIPDGSSSVSRTFNVAQNIKVESVEVVFTASHISRGQLRVTLTSPSGAQSFLAVPRADNGDNYSSWVFMTRKHLDELSAGNWTLTVSDATAGTAGTWTNWRLNIYGTALNQRVNYVTVRPGESDTSNDFGSAFDTTLDASGADDLITVRRSLDGTQFEIFQNVPTSGTPTYSVPVALPSLTLNASSGNDSFVVDFTNGDPTPAGGLTLIGASNTTADAVSLAGVTSPVTISPAAASTTVQVGAVSFVVQSAEAIDATSASALTFVTPAASNDALSSTQAAPGIQQLSGTVGGVGFPAVNFTQAAPVTLNASGGTDTLGLSSGSLSATILTAGNLAATISGATLVSNASLTLASLSIGAGGLFRLAAAANRVLITTGLFIDPAGFLDLTDNDMIIRNGFAAEATYRAYVAAAAANAFSSVGIGSTLADPAGLAVGIANNADLALATFAGSAVTTDDVLIKYTWYGDADLNGQVDGDDYLLWLAVFGSTGPDIGWAQGDFDSDTDVDGDDYLLWLQNFGNGIGDPI